MFAHITQQLRRRSARAVTLLAGVLVASMGFILLTGSVDTSRLRVQSTADANFRAAYDILVRPVDAGNALEVASGEVGPNFLSGQFGGITVEDWERIAALEGVEVAAPIAMLGYHRTDLSIEMDITDLLDPALDQQVLRLDRTWIADHGLTQALDPGPDFVYVTKNPVLEPRKVPFSDGVMLEDGYTVDSELLHIDTSGCQGSRPAAELLPSGEILPLCRLDHAFHRADPLTAEGRDRLIVVEWREDGSFSTTGTGEVDYPESGDRAVIDIPWPTTLLVAAIDPASETALVKLDAAVVQGDYLTADPPEKTDGHSAMDRVEMPMLVSSRPQTEESVRIDIGRVAMDAADLPGQSSADMEQQLPQVPVEPLGSEIRDYATAYTGVVERDDFGVWFNRFQQAEPPLYRPGTDVLRPDTTDRSTRNSWTTDVILENGVPPWLTQDTGFREVYGTSELVVSASGHAVGTFDPTAISTFSGLSEVPLESYRPAAAPGADERSRELLGERPWLPNSNPTGYLATPPQLLTNLASLDHLLHPASPQAAAPLSAVRVRVAGVTGLDDASQERVRQVAERIATGTGLTVDITVGSSPAPREVEVAAGQFGRPALLIEEHWTRKGAAVDLVREADRKSVLLSGLVLLVCALFTGNLVAASVRTRRAELGTLACLGWSGRRLAALVLGEVAAVAATAAVLAAVLAPLLAGLTGLTVWPALALLTVPLVTALALLAALGPALRAARIGPAGVLRPPVLAGGRARARRSVVALAAAQVTRVPVRAALAVLSLAVGIAAVTFVTAVLWHFRGAAAGTLLGQAVTLEIRAVDLAAVMLTVLLGAFALADVLYVGLRERDAELAVLRATGWSDRALTRLVMAEGALLGAAGAVLGAAAGAGLAAWVVGALPAGVLGTALGAAVGGVALAVAASLFPVRLVRGLPLAALLSRQ
ncbi:FtsX-like permease family protein [Streptomyces carpaticus]|uniref:FtsX-like permease family protein n=1 Tax=Streptomyces carpaticus TaxID=285558 RepID=UPI0031F83C29